MRCDAYERISGAAVHIEGPGPGPDQTYIRVRHIRRHFGIPGARTAEVKQLQKFRI